MIVFKIRRINKPFKKKILEEEKGMVINYDSYIFLK